MAVYTKVSLEQASISLQDYDIGMVLSCDEISSGVENSNFFITTDSGKYVLTLYEKRVSESDLPYFLSLMEHLHGKDFPCPRPVSDSSGRILHRINGRAAALFSFLSGSSLLIDEISPSHCAEVGVKLAELHLATSDFTGVRHNNLSYSGWVSLLDQAASSADMVRPGLAQKLSMELYYIHRHWSTSLPYGTCHADLFPDNIFFSGGNLCGVIDFYFACTDCLAYDLAIALNAWCFVGGHFVWDRGSAFLRSYDSVRPLCADERLALPLLARGAALRFLLTRLLDWVNHDEEALVIPHDPMDFYSILSFHQSISDCRDYGF